MALTVVPNQGVDKGNTSVHIWGHNFPETADKTYFCKFGADVVRGTWEARNHVICPSPAQPEGEVILEVSPNGTIYTSNKVMIKLFDSGLFRIITLIVRTTSIRTKS